MNWQNSTGREGVKPRMPAYQSGRATLEYKSGKKSKPCDNCGVTHATMYQLGLARLPGEKPNLKWRLCVTCRSHVESLFEKHTREWLWR
jgi:hypothetical protein